MKQIVVYILFLLLTLGCEKYEKVIEKEYPPAVWTLTPIEIDSTGATFRGDIVGYSTSEINSYGFNYGNIRQIVYKKHLEQDTNLFSSTFQLRIDTLLAKGIKYYIQAFIVKDDETIYGNKNYFISEGCEHAKWFYRGTFNIKNVPFGIYNKNNYFFLTYNGDLYRFNPKSLELFELSGFAAYDHFGWTPIHSCSDDAIYIISPNTSQLYKYVYEDDAWMKESIAPFIHDAQIEPYHYSFFHNNKVYFLGRSDFYCYDQSTKQWTELKRSPSGNIEGCLNIEDRTYILTEEKSIYSYNISDNTWHKIETVYPGSFSQDIPRLNYERVLSYQNDNKLYFLYGKDHFEYNIAANEWEKLESLGIAFDSHVFFEGSLYCYHFTDTDKRLHHIHQFDLLRN